MNKNLRLLILHQLNLKIKQSISLNFNQLWNKKSRSLVVHHGLMGSSKNFRSIVKNPKISSYVNSYLIDCRNHGQSPATQSHLIPDLAGDLKEFLQKNVFPKSQKVTLMGHSMGGRAIICLTLLFPELQHKIDRVIFIDISPQSLDRNENVRQNWLKTGKMLQLMNKISLNAETQQIYKQIQKIAVNKDTANLLKADLQILSPKEHKWTTNLQTIVQNYYKMGEFDLTKDVKITKRWQKPVSIIYGSKSLYVNHSDIQSYKFLYPNIKTDDIYKVEGAGHWVHFDKTIQFLEIVSNILKNQQS